MPVSVSIPLCTFNLLVKCFSFFLFYQADHSVRQGVLQHSSWGAQLSRVAGVQRCGRPHAAHHGTAARPRGPPGMGGRAGGTLKGVRQGQETRIPRG